jgi:hypothetical protein
MSDGLETDGSGILPYQAGRTLDNVPGYSAGLQLQLSSGDKVYLALSATELAVYFETNLALHYDLEARLVRVAETSQYWRRGLSHRVLYSRKLTAEEGGGLERTPLDEAAADSLVAQTQASMAAIHDELETGKVHIEHAKPSLEEATAHIRPLLARAAKFDVAAARQDAERFAKIYGRVAILPSDDYSALVLQATEGCGFGGCTFCELYTGVRFHTKTEAEFAQHVKEAIAYHGQTLRMRRNIFLGEANALNAPQRTVVDFFRELHRHFEFPGADQRHVPASWWLGSETRFEAVHSFIDVFSGTPRSALDWTELRRHGLRRVYIGMESGCDLLLEWMRKPVRAEAVRRTVLTLKEADINVGLIVLLGAGGQEFYRLHVTETLELLNHLPLGTGDFIYFSPLVIYPGGPYADLAKKGGIHSMTLEQMKRQEAEIRSQLRFDQRRGRPYLAKYEVELFVY